MKPGPELTRSIAFWLFVIGYFLIWISPGFLSDGIFLDGLIYSTVARNLSEGLGSFWNPYFTATCFSEFHEHPPLALGIQSLFFTVLGNGRLTEKIYSLFTFAVTALIIVRIWKASGYRNSWLPVFMWFAVPVVSWACQNNMLENTLTIFTTLSLLFYIESNRRKKILFLFLSGMMLTLGFLTKGFVAFFPWSLPFFFWLTGSRAGLIRMLSDSVLMVFSTIVTLGLVMLIPDAFISIRKYFDGQVIGSLSGITTVDSRFYIVKRLASELLPGLIIVLFLFLSGYNRKVKTKTGKDDLRTACALFLTGLAGVLPIMISMKQSGFYIVPAIPFFALGLAVLIKERSGSLIDRININSRTFRYLAIVSGIVFLTGIFLIFFNLNRFGRDEVKLKDTYKILPLIPSGTIINILPEMSDDWPLHGYYFRLKEISLDPDMNNKRDFLLVRKEIPGEPAVMEGFEEIGLNTSEFHLFKRKQ